MSGKLAVVTLSIPADSKNNRWMKAGLPSKKEYAKRIGADFINITQPKLGGSVASEKYQIGGMLDRYDRVVYLDADLFIRPDAPSLFDVVPADHFGIFDESYGGDPLRERTALMAWLRDGFPGCKCPHYFNNGVFVTSQEHQWLFDHANLNRKLTTYEQTQMVHRLWEALSTIPPQVKVHFLSKSWNWMPRTWVGNRESPRTGWIPEPKPDPCWITHLPCHRPEERATLLEDLNKRYGCTQ